MIISNRDILNKYDEMAKTRIEEILNSSDGLVIPGVTYFVASDGNDRNDGLSPDTAWRTPEKVSAADLKPGDGVLFKRGDVFRGGVIAKEGVTYGAFGSGKKPRLYGWEKNLADESLWTLADENHNIWKMTEKILDTGTLVFNEGELCSIKLIPSYIKGRFVCRNDEQKLFDMAEEMTRDLDIYWHFDELLTSIPSVGECFPVPEMGDKSYGDLYLRCDNGNPGKVFDSIEALPRRHMFKVGAANDVRIDNICIKYVGLHAIGADGECVRGLKVTNCEIGWIGGTIQHYFGTDPNYPQGGRGTVTRYGNGVEIYGGCKDYQVCGCYIYQVYDAGITHQITTFGKKRTMEGVLYKDNVVENCVYSIEYFLDMNEGDEESYMDGVEISGNILRLSGCGWGQQRHNVDTPAHINGWGFVNKAVNFRITGNIFDRAAYRMLRLVAKDEQSCPYLDGNTYIQYYGKKIGQYGGNAVTEPENLDFDETVAEKIRDVFGDKHAVVIGLKN